MEQPISIPPHGGEGRSGDLRPEAIRRRPRKASKSHKNGAIPGTVKSRVSRVRSTLVASMGPDAP